MTRLEFEEILEKKDINMIMPYHYYNTEKLLVI